MDLPAWVSTETLARAVQKAYPERYPKQPPTRVVQGWAKRARGPGKDSSRKEKRKYLFDPSTEAIGHLLPKQERYSASLIAAALADIQAAMREPIVEETTEARGDAPGVSPAGAPTAAGTPTTPTDPVVEARPPDFLNMNPVWASAREPLIEFDGGWWLQGDDFDADLGPVEWSGRRPNPPIGASDFDRKANCTWICGERYFALVRARWGG